jgi:hypothetical protein
MKTYGGVDVYIHVLVTSALVGGKWSASRPGRFTPHPRGKYRRYPLDRRLGGSQSRSGRRGEDKILGPTGTRTPTPRPSSPQPVAIPTELFRLQYLGDQIKMDERVTAHSWYEWRNFKFWLEILKGRNCLQDACADLTITLKCVMSEVHKAVTIKNLLV